MALQRRFWIRLVWVACCVPAAGHGAEVWTCLQDGLVREVTIYYPRAPEKVPCEVFYSKRHENAVPRALWSANHEVGYCERKAEAFVEKLRALGWQCSAETVDEGDTSTSEAPGPLG